MKTITSLMGSHFSLLPWIFVLVVAGVWLSCRLLRRREFGIMGGAFNPIHNGHLRAAAQAAEQFALDRVLFVPSGNPPHKKSGLLDKEVRFDMVEAAMSVDPRFEASRLEIDRAGVTWTIDTLKQLRAQRFRFRRVRLNFIIGEDNIASIRDYHRRDELLSLCRLLVCPRLVADRRSQEEWRKALPGADMEVLDFSANELSSTLVRSLVADGKSIAGLVPEPVDSIIQQRGLYMLKPEPTNTSSQQNAA